MPKPKAAVPKALLKAWIPMELRAKLDLLLFSDLEQRVPLGEYSKFVEGKIREEFSFLKLDMSLYGFPPGFFVQGPAGMVVVLEDYLRRNPAKGFV